MSETLHDGVIRSLIHSVSKNLPCSMYAATSEQQLESIRKLLERVGYSADDPRARAVVRNYLSDAPSVRLLQASEASSQRDLLVHDITDYLVGAAIRKFRLSKSDAEDIVETTWVKALVNLHQYQFRSRLLTWMFVILLREAARFRALPDRMARSLDEETNLGIPRLDLIPDTAPTPDELALAEDRHAAVKEALESAIECICSKMRSGKISKSDKRRIAYLCFSEHVNPQAIARSLNLKASDVRRIKHRIRKKLRDDADLRRFFSRRFGSEEAESTN